MGPLGHEYSFAAPGIVGVSPHSALAQVIIEVRQLHCSRNSPCPSVRAGDSHDVRTVGLVRTSCQQNKDRQLDLVKSEFAWLLHGSVGSLEDLVEVREPADFRGQGIGYSLDCPISGSPERLI